MCTFHKYNFASEPYLAIKFKNENENGVFSIVIMMIQHRLIPGNQSSCEVSTQNFKRTDSRNLFFFCVGFSVSSISPLISVTWNPKPQPPLAHYCSIKHMDASKISSIGRNLFCLQEISDKST